MKKKVLFIYSKMVVGGSTTSLLSLLNNLDYNLYDVDLLLYSDEGKLQDQINPLVNVLPPLNGKVKRFKKIVRLDYWLSLIRSRYLSRKTRNSLINAQFMARYEAEACPELEQEYDVGISFLEFWPMEFLVRRVKAKKKIGWIHIDIKEAGLIHGVNNHTFAALDKIVMVSQSCVENMKMIYPALSDKIVCVENILSSDTIRKMSHKIPNMSFKNSGLRFVTVCRIVFASKGLDRAVGAFARLKKENILDASVCWYIIGDGPDKERLGQMIKENHLDSHIKLLGQQINPYCIEKYMDIFLLPSRYEGKPMAVTEAQMLGLIPMVCSYSSAHEQIVDGYDGIIAKNDEEDIYIQLKAVLQGQYDLALMKNRIIGKDYSNIIEIDKIMNMIS